MPDNKPVTLDGMKFDDGGDAHHEEEQHSQGIARAEAAEASADEPTSETFRIYKTLIGMGQATRGNLALEASRQHKIEYTRSSAALWHFVKSGKVKEVREPGKPIEFKAMFTLEQAKNLFRKPGQHYGKLPLAEGPATLAFQLFELLKKFPGSTPAQLRGYVMKLDGDIAHRGTSAALSKYSTAGLARYEMDGGTRRWFAIADKYPAGTVSYRKKPKKAKTAAKEAAPVTQWMHAPSKKPKPAPPPLPDLQSIKQTDFDASAKVDQTMRVIHGQNTLRDMSVDDILAALSLPKALALHRALAKLLGHE